MPNKTLQTAQYITDIKQIIISAGAKAHTAGKTAMVEAYWHISMIYKLIIPFMKNDIILTKHYSFLNKELDFNINYDIKYRMGSKLRRGGMRYGQV